MLKITGAGMIFLASILSAYRMLLEKRKKQELFASLQNSLTYLSREIGERMPSLAECFEFLAENGTCERTRRFYRLIREQMEELGEREFSKIWRESVLRELDLPDDREREILLGVGQALAGSDLSALCRSLDAAAQCFSERIEREENEKRDYRRLAFGISLSLGAFAIIILI